MARIARVVAPGMPHHVTQRGNRRLQTFFHDEDYHAYLELMSEWCDRYKVRILAYCLMPNHVHLIAVSEAKEGLNLAIGEAHRRYTRRINFREGWRGHLWQGKFSSFILDQNHLLACARYVELNPVRAGIVKKPQAWRWSSANAHVRCKDDLLVRTKPLLAMIESPWGKFLSVNARESGMVLFRKYERTGRSIGDDAFIERLERLLGRELKPKETGSKGYR
jgi:putative transposase